MRIAKRVVLGVAAIVVAGLLLGACMSSDPSGDVGSGPADGDAIELIAADNRFLPTTIEAKAGDEITVEVENTGDSPHEFQIEELDLNTGTIEPGRTAHATLTVPDGTTEFACAYHDGMKGRIETI